MNKGNANRVAIDLGPSMTPAVRDSPGQELTIACSLRNRHASHPTPRLTVGVDLSQLDLGYWYEVTPEELADAAERGDAVPFDAPFIIPKQSISIPHTPGLERMRRCSAIRDPAPLGICITLSCPLNDELDLD
ncbi:hypothetical protein ACFSQT_17500 [Mesorhizobium calcicola]|uniref:Uncharacterized protein n=1 Tax=Mesorhizobium calcicola TaxID=1300310 RepID=A0ABW4WDZ4_9HYPH